MSFRESPLRVGRKPSSPLPRKTSTSNDDRSLEVEGQSCNSRHQAKAEADPRFGSVASVQIPCNGARVSTSGAGIIDVTCSCVAPCRISLTMWRWDVHVLPGLSDQRVSRCPLLPHVDGSADAQPCDILSRPISVQCSPHSAPRSTHRRRFMLPSSSFTLCPGPPTQWLAKDS